MKRIYDLQFTIYAAIHVIVAFGLLAELLAAERAHGNLTATVSPGYQFPLDGSVAPTYALLNELATPTIIISGTVGGGTNSGIAPNSISGIEMQDNFPDGGALGLPSGLQTLGWNTANPRQLSVNTPGIVDSYSGITSYHTNALVINYDPNFLALQTNDAAGFSTGYPQTNWLTIKGGSIYDGLIAPGGISSSSITNAGLLASILNMKQIFTNIFTITGGTYTNTSTNYNTVIVGTNGLGTIAQLGPGLLVTNLPTQFVFSTNGTSYTNNVNVPTLIFAGLTGSLPLQVNMAPWTNSQFVNQNSGTFNVTSLVVTAYNFGGAQPYTNWWAGGLQASSGGGFISATYQFITNAPGTGTGTNGSQVVLRAQVHAGGNWSATFWISNIVQDATLQQAGTYNPVLFTFHDP